MKRLFFTPLVAGLLILFLLLLGKQARAGMPLDVAPFGTPLPGEPGKAGVIWEDPREIHRVVVHFKGPAPEPDRVRLEYWGSRWPQQHLPKDREPGGGDVGWMELGDWYRYGWRTADTEKIRNGSVLTFRFHPVNAREFPRLGNYPAAFRYTLKVRVVGDSPLPPVERLEAFTDSTWEPRFIRLAWEHPPGGTPRLTAFNGVVERVEVLAPNRFRAAMQATVNPDPNTYDRTLVTVQRGQDVFSFTVDDLARGALLLPHLGVAVLPDTDQRSYAEVLAAQRNRKDRTLYDRVAHLPEQTWAAAWKGMPSKRSPIWFPLGLDGGRQRFRLNPDGSLLFRTNDHYLSHRPGKDTPGLALEPGPVHIGFGLPSRPRDRSLEETGLPICRTSWEVDGIRVTQRAFVTCLEGARADGPVPPGDASTIFLARFTFTNSGPALRKARLPLFYQPGGKTGPLRVDEAGHLWAGGRLRGQVLVQGGQKSEGDPLSWSWQLAPGQSGTLVIKLPYFMQEPDRSPASALDRLDFDREHRAMAGYWQRRLNQGAHLITPEPMLNEFHRAHASHLLINCEREPGSDRRFARVGSFGYGAFANESCMMVVDLDRRGYHQEAQACLDSWLRYQGTVKLPGDFASQEGILYGAGGYEAGGYNQHHGWVLWCLAEHYRFTRDEAWLRRATPGIIKAAEWIIKERKRTTAYRDLRRGLLPSGSLEDIGDWWTWLSTNCYTWRGLDSAAWALEQIAHPEAVRFRREADAYHTSLIAAFQAARERSPVVRLRDGTAVPHFPSHVNRRGRCFGWICETLEGALHLLITRALDPSSPEAKWILKDYEDNLYLSRQYGYTLDDFERYWFGRGGMSMQACLLFHVEPYLYRDDVKHALRGAFNALAVSYFPDVCMNTEHALPDMGSWRGDHFKSSDEANAAGWLRYLFVREEKGELLLGQAVPREWLRLGQKCGIERTATHFGPVSLYYAAAADEIRAIVMGPRRNPPPILRVRFRDPGERPLASVAVNGKPWKDFKGEWVCLPGDIGQVDISARFR